MPKMEAYMIFCNENRRRFIHSFIHAKRKYWQRWHNVANRIVRDASVRWMRFLNISTPLCWIDTYILTFSGIMLSAMLFFIGFSISIALCIHHFYFSLVDAKWFPR